MKADHRNRLKMQVENGDNSEDYIESSDTDDEDDAENYHNTTTGNYHNPSTGNNIQQRGRSIGNSCNTTPNNVYKCKTEVQMKASNRKPLFYKTHWKKIMLNLKFIVCY